MIRNHALVKKVTDRNDFLQGHFAKTVVVDLTQLRF